MSPLDTLAWWQWAILAAVPPAIVLLYFLKLRRKPLVVPSTFLWRKSIEDMRANSIWQRLRANLLLVLQLLLVGLVILALVRPSWSGSKLVGHRFILLIDTSASMNSRDEAPTRLDEAKRRALVLVEQMAEGDVAMIISFSDVAQVEQVFTDNRRQLQRRVAAIVPTNRTTALGDALRVAAGMASRASTSQPPEVSAAAGLPATVYIFSDGRFSDVENFSLGSLAPVFVPIGRADAANVGITAFGVRRSGDAQEHAAAFVRLDHCGPGEVSASVELYRDDALVDVKTVQLGAHESGGTSFDLGELESGLLRAAVHPGGTLSTDDNAWAAIDPPLRRQVLLVTPGNDVLEKALTTDSARAMADVQVEGVDYLETQEYRRRAAEDYYALVIYDQCTVPQMPEANTLFVGTLPPRGGWSHKKTVLAPAIIDVEASHPLMYLVVLGDVRFAEAAPLVPPSGATVLVSSDAGPLVAIAPRERFEDLVVGAEIVGRDATGQRTVNTDWPLRLSFPVFVLNALDYFTDAAKLNSLSVEPGHPAPLASLGQGDELVVRSPGGKETKLVRSRANAFHFSGTEELGVYTVEQPGQPARHFSVNLLSSLESDVVPRSEIHIGYDDVRGEANWEGARGELWKPLLLGALGVLLVEWYIYVRRTYP